MAEVRPLPTLPVVPQAPLREAGEDHPDVHRGGGGARGERALPHRPLPADHNVVLKQLPQHKLVLRVMPVGDMDADLPPHERRLTRVSGADEQPPRAPSVSTRPTSFFGFGGPPLTPRGSVAAGAELGRLSERGDESRDSLALARDSEDYGPRGGRRGSSRSRRGPLTKASIHFLLDSMISHAKTCLK